MITLPTLNALSDDRRGVSEVLGAVLVFALVLLLLMLVQVTAVPVANQQLEFEHSKRALDDVQTFDLAVDSAASTGLGASTSIEAGVRYPTRLFLLNPPPATGAVRTTGGGTFALEGFQATNPESADYLDATATPMAFETTGLEYAPSYNEFRNAPVTHYEAGVVYDVYDDGALVRDTGAVVSGTRITLVSLAGSMSTTSVDNIVLETAPISAPSRPVSVSAPAGAEPSIVVHTTGLSEDQWREEVLANAYDPSGAPDNDRYVTAVDCLVAGVPGDRACDGLLRITFEPDVTYDLRMAKVGIGSEFDEEAAYYLTTPQTGTITVPSGGAQELVVVARDRFNNPVSGVPVGFALDTAGAGAFVGDHTDVRTDEDGRARVVFAADPDFAGGSVAVSATGGDLGDDPDGNGDPVETGTGAVGAHEVVDFSGRLTVNPPPSDDGDDGLDINPNSTGKVALVDTSAVGGGGSSSVSLTFEYKGSGSVDLVGGRVNYHSTGGPGASAGTAPTSVQISGTTLAVSGEFRTISPALPVEDTGTAVALTWDEDIEADHLYILTLEFSNGHIETYFVSHPM